MVASPGVRLRSFLLISGGLTFGWIWPIWPDLKTVTARGTCRFILLTRKGCPRRILGVFIDLFCAGGSLSLTTPRTPNDYPRSPKYYPPHRGVVHKISKVVKTERLPPRPGGSHSKIPMITTRDYPPDYPPTRGVVTGEIIILQNFRLRRSKTNVNSL